MLTIKNIFSLRGEQIGYTKWYVADVISTPESYTIMCRKSLEDKYFISHNIVINRHVDYKHNTELYYKIFWTKYAPTLETIYGTLRSKSQLLYNMSIAIETWIDI
jgi:hypothetical protein